MNTTILRALLEDSRQQVLDNKVFRLLVILTGIPILITFLIGFYPDRMVILWGFDPIYWPDLLGDIAGSSVEGDFGAIFIRGFQDLILERFAGTLGVIFSIAATAFFMPRVLEKGAADTLFSKPVSRLAILLSRYVAGLLFIAGIAIVLVVGMFLGLGIRSGFWDPGFLWGALTLVYLFGMMHAFSLCVAVLTRSSTAAILMTLVLFLFCGGIHRAWTAFEYGESMRAMEFVRSARQMTATADSETAAPERTEEQEEISAFSVLKDTLYAMHYVLPKTSDADIITRKLQRSLTEPAPQAQSDDGELIVLKAPMGMTRVEESADDLTSEGVVWRSETGAAITLRRFERPHETRGSGERQRSFAQSGSQRAREFEDSLEEREDVVEGPEDSRDDIGGVWTFGVHWKEQRGDRVVLRERRHLHYGDHMIEIDYERPEGAPAAEHRLDRFLQPTNFVVGDERSLGREEWYEKTLSWTAPWKFNIFFSIGSSLAFIAAMLGIAWARLQRIDF